VEKIKLCYIVDDDEIYQFVTRRIIEETGLVVEIKTFVNGLEAYKSLQSCLDTPESLPEIIFLDLSMPVMDGWGFLEKYLSLSPPFSKKAKVCIVSSSVDPADVERAKHLPGVMEYIIKPFTKDKFSRIAINLTSL
jgi:CheY-like chemotaxis protein